jgi:outer membrane lipoprotein-sorting protein
MLRVEFKSFQSQMLGTFSALLCGLIFMSPAEAVSPDTTDARAIMDAVESRARGDRVRGRVVMTVTDGSGRSRQRVVQSWTLDFPKGTRTLMLFEQPANVKNTGMLSIDYSAGDRDDDQWLYLPSLHRSTRISSGEKSGSFFGTDLSYADMTKADPSHYTYKVLKPSVKLKSGEECWLIESRPKTARAKSETGYVKTQIWVSKSKLIPLQVKAWIREGKKLKYIQFGDLAQFGDIWLPRKISARTRRGKKTESTTVIQFTELKLNDPEITEALFTQRRLEQGL